MNAVVIFLLTAAVLAAGQNQTPARFKVIREWKYLNFTWPSEESYAAAMQKGLYIPENNIIAGIKYFENYYYLTLPRMRDGVPATLVRIPAGPTNNTAPALEPFPSWQMNQEDDCNALQNVQNVEIDAKGQIWIIDGGRRETLLPIPTVKCPPKLIIYDIIRNMSTLMYTFPEEVASKNGSYLYDIVVDNTDGGFAYITDNGAQDPGIVVFSLKENKSWKIRSSLTMKADPTAVNFRVNSTIIKSPINIAAIALGPKLRTSNAQVLLKEDREVYFCPLSSFNMYSIDSSVLKNESSSMDPEYQGDIKDLGKKASQTVGMIMDNRGILYYNLLSINAISKWDTNTPFTSGQTIIAKDNQYLQWPNSFTFDMSGNITVTTNRLPKFIYEKLNINEPNFRIITAKVGGKSYLYDEQYEYNSATTGNTIHREGFRNSATRGNAGDISPKEPQGVSTPSTEPTYHVFGRTTAPLPGHQGNEGTQSMEPKLSSEHPKEGQSSTNQNSAVIFGANVFSLIVLFLSTLL